MTARRRTLEKMSDEQLTEWAVKLTEKWWSATEAWKDVRVELTKRGLPIPTDGAWSE